MVAGIARRARVASSASTTFYKFAPDVTVVAGQDQKISPEWRPKAVLVLNLPPDCAAAN